MPSEDKVKEVAELEQVLSQAPVIIATGYRGLKVADLFQLRKQLRAQGVRYRIVKNTLTKLAAERAGKQALASLLQGPTALALGAADPVAATKAIQDFIRTTKLPLEVYGGLIDSRAYSSADLEKLTTLPPREVLIAQLLGSIQGPISGLMGVLSAPVQNLLWLLQARVEQLGGTSD
ncbi:MAG: 50S ribosomal protein L10 [Chloroflexi bacterium]|nr:50S ribosomal protein L10 [Chloroflexota bacterium]